MSEDYIVTSMEFKGKDSVDHYNYLLSFNKSLIRTGNLIKIEEGLNNKTDQILQELKNELEIILDNAQIKITQEKSKGEICEYLFSELEDTLQLIEKKKDE